MVVPKGKNKIKQTKGCDELLSQPSFNGKGGDEMYPNTQQKIEEKRQLGVYSGVAYHFFDGSKEEQQIIGEAALKPEREKLTKAHLFDVASLTKVICTTSVVLRLLEQEKVTLDEPLQIYLPTFKDSKITIRHLLTHTSDIVTWIPNRDQLSSEALKQAYLGLEAGEQLGKEVKYTDAGTILLGFLLEYMYEESLTTIFKREVLQPLGMAESYFPPIAPLLPVVPTEQLEDGTILKGLTHDPKARILAEHAGNAGLFTTIDDVALFVRMYLRNSGEYFKQTTIEKLQQDQTPNQKGARSLGWDLKGEWLFHTGYTGTFILLHIKKQQGMIFLSNRVHPIDFRERYIQERDEIIATYLAEVESENVL